MQTLNRHTVKSVAALLMFSTAGMQAQQSSSPPQPPKPPTPAAAASPKAPVGTTSPASPRSPRAAVAPRAGARTLTGQSLFEREIEETVTARLSDFAELQGLTIAGQLAPLAALNLDAQALQESARIATMDGQRAAIEGARLAIDGQRAAIAGMTFAGPAYVSANGFGDAVASTMSSGSRAFRTQAPASWDAQDAADSLYREARRALSSDNYPIAAMLFRRIREQHPKSTYTPDAFYWEAFAMQRISEKGAPSQKASLNGALEVLAMQQEKYPKASTRSDASALRTRIEGQLARLGDLNAIASLADKARNATSDGCPRAQDDERIDALNAVAQMDAEKAMPILKKVLLRREACTQQLRQTAVWLVASRKQPEAADILLNVAKTDPDKNVREQAVFWMSNVPTDEATTMLIDLAKKGDDMDLRKKAIYSLSRSKSPRAMATIKEIALDANADVDLRGDALNWYMSGPGRTADDAMTFLKEVYGRADDMRFKQRVLQIISSRRTDDSRAFLVDVAQNAKESMEIRRSAIWSLNGSGVTNAQLAQIYDRGTELEIRKQVIGVLGSLRDNGGIDKLLDIGRNEKNVELRKTAITYLTRSKDPRALALLQEIIEK